MSSTETNIAHSDMWQRHPDGLALLTAGDGGRFHSRRHTTVAVNPAMERLYHSNELVGHSAALLVPYARLSPTNDSADVFSAHRRDGTTFAVTSSFVELGAPDDLSMLIVRDVTALTAWRDELSDLRNDRLDQVEQRERAVAEREEKLAQALYAAGIALRLCKETLCKETGTGDAAPPDLERTLEFLDRMMNDLIAGA